ncbi:nuclear transport factor 2 family protein [Maribacter sp. X9]|uniref:nuclear transport factor 2 family protein n=1 Tax=Maribacter sp. X9 TaxID=3402159 RepID=UPI003AF36804
MKRFFYVFFGLFSFVLTAQNEDEIGVKRALDDFFTAFHAQDSVALKNIVHPEIVLQTIGKTKDGDEQLKNEDFHIFLKSIVSIPDSIRFEERLMDYSIQIDGPMANAWTPYEFWLNAEFHHCGVNSFQLLKEKGNWKIIYLIDTRRKDNCYRRTE